MVIKKRWALYTILILAVLAFGCKTIVSRPDPVSKENFANLKDFHLGFIENFTEGPGKTWNLTDIQNTCEDGEIKFLEAIEYEKLKAEKEQTRIKAFEILHEEFQKNCNFLVDNHRLFKEIFSNELKSEVEENYNKAMKGELIRMSNP